MTTEIRKEWPQFYGTIEKLVIRDGRKGRFARMTVNCKTFEKTAFIFKPETIDAAIAAGEGARVWFKGPEEEVQKSNGQGGTFTQTQQKVVYFKDRTPREETAGDDAGEETGEDTASQAADAALEEEIPF